MTKPRRDAAKPSNGAKRRVDPRESLDAQKRLEVCAILAIGCSRNRAAAFVGCCAKTILNTARRDPEFAVALRKAEAQQEVSLLTSIHAATKRSEGWRAASWLLQRLYPDRYARRAGTMTSEQVGTVLAQFAEILSRNIRNAEDRRKVGAELLLLTEALVSEGQGDQVR